MANKGTLSRNTRLSMRQTDYKRLLAYQRLGIDPEKVQQEPFFRMDLLRIRRLVLPRDANKPASASAGLLDSLQLSDDPDARKVLQKYQSVPVSYRRLLTPEAFCQAAGVSPWKVLQIIAGGAAWFAILESRERAKLLFGVAPQLDASDQLSHMRTVTETGRHLPQRRMQS